MKSILNKLRNELPKVYEYVHHLFENRARPSPYQGHTLKGYIKIGIRAPKQNQVTALSHIFSIMPFNDDGILVNKDPSSSS